MSLLGKRGGRASALFTGRPGEVAEGSGSPHHPPGARAAPRSVRLWGRSLKLLCLPLGENSQVLSFSLLRSLCHSTSFPRTFPRLQYPLERM